MFSRKHPLPIPPGTLHLCYVVPANGRSETLSTSKRRSRGMCSFTSLGLLWHFLGKLSENALVFLLRRRCQAFHGPEKAAGASPRFRFSRLFVSSLETLNHYCKSSHIILQTISFENRMEPHVEPVSFGCQSLLRSEQCQFPGNIVRPALNQYLARTYFRNCPGVLRHVRQQKTSLSLQASSIQCASIRSALCTSSVRIWHSCSRELIRLSAHSTRLPRIQVKVVCIFYSIPVRSCTRQRCPWLHGLLIRDLTVIALYCSCMVSTA